MARFYRKKKKKVKQNLGLLEKLSPMLIVCFCLFLFFTLLSGLNRIAIICLAIVFALIPNAYSLYKSYKQRMYYLNLDVPEIDNLTGIEFEKLLSAYYKQIGYKVEDTPVVSDYGADLILEKNDRKYVLQAKRYKNKVGVAAIQQVVTSKAHYNADGAIVATNNYFTKNAWNLAKENHVFLIDRAKLIELKDEVEKSKQNK